MDKDALRHQARLNRDAIAPDIAAAAATKIAQLFFENPEAAVKTIAGYMPIRGEISPLPLLSRLHENGVCCALPVVAADRLIFRSFAPSDDLVSGDYGILVPSADKPEVVPDLILVPLLAFDRNCHRLGYGAGHYDRTLAAQDIKTMGLAFAAQEVAALPVEPHDIALHAILTEKGFINSTPARL